MQCSGCGKQLKDGVTVCLHCGTPIPHRAGVSVGVASYPPLPDAVLPSGGHWEITSIPASPYATVSPTQAPPPPMELYASGTPPYTLATGKQRRFARWHIVLGSVLLVVALMAGGVGIGYARGVFSLPGSGRAPANVPSGASTPHCVLPVVNHTIPVLTNVQMATRLGKNDAPLDNATTFTVGNTIFVTFKFATNDSGILVASWCLADPNEVVPPFSLPPVVHQSGRTAYMELQNLSVHSLGSGSVVLTWNNAIIAALQFTVKQ